MELRIIEIPLLSGKRGTSREGGQNPLERDASD